ncbi:MAG: hypothetical protein ACO3B3_12110 [Cyanobium sp.]
MAITIQAHGSAPATHEEQGRPMHRSHEGLVVELGSSYMGDGDSTFFALVYNAATDDFDSIAYCSTYCSRCDHGRGREIEGWCRAVVDAPDHLRAKLAARRQATLEAQQAERARIEMENAWHTPERGAIVRIVAGRKIPQGLEGQVTWRGQSDYGMRVRVRFDNGEEEFTAEHNVEVIDWPGKSHHCTIG